jgi:Uncharacterized protein conserved in bacteria
MTQHPGASTGHSAAARPWYREPWPWLIMSGPALAVIAGCYTLWLAVSSSDGLVADDYYKRGLAINQTLTRERAAVAAHYEARVMLAPDGGRVRIMLSGESLPDAVRLRLVHPTRAGLDRLATLEAAGGGIYEGRLDVPSTGRWHVSLEDREATWRLVGEWTLPPDAPLVMGGR